MLPPASLPMPATWRDLLEELAPVFRRRSTRRLFVALACGMILADRSTVVAMAAAAGMAGKWRRAHWFFSGAAGTPMTWAWPWRGWWWRCWSPAGEPVVVAIDDTLFRAAGKEGLYLQP